MSGPKPRQQKSRSPKGKVTEDLEVFSKEEAVEIAKRGNYDDLTFDFDLGEDEDNG
jgi:hypothetical protein